MTTLWWWPWPQIILAALLLIGVGSCGAKYGQKQTGTYDIVDVLIGPALMAALLYWGGFWTGGH